MKSEELKPEDRSLKRAICGKKHQQEEREWSNAEGNSIGRESGNRRGKDSLFIPFLPTEMETEGRQEFLPILFMAVCPGTGAVPMA